MEPSEVRQMVDGEFVAELGMSMEQHLFGRMPKLLPADVGSDYTKRLQDGRSAYCMTLLSFPRDSDNRKFKEHINYEKNWPDPTLDTRYLVPTYFAQRLQTDDFWLKELPKYGSEALLIPKPLVSDAVTSMAVNRTFRAKESEEYASLSQKYQRAMEDYWYQKKLYNRLRPWYAKERKCC